MTIRTPTELKIEEFFNNEALKSETEQIAKAFLPKPGEESVMPKLVIITVNEHDYRLGRDLVSFIDLDFNSSEVKQQALTHAGAMCAERYIKPLCRHVGTAEND